jgi:hypothetical protein
MDSFCAVLFSSFFGHYFNLSILKIPGQSIYPRNCRRQPDRAIFDDYEAIDGWFTSRAGVSFQRRRCRTECHSLFFILVLESCIQEFEVRGAVRQRIGEGPGAM